MGWEWQEMLRLNEGLLSICRYPWILNRSRGRLDFLVLAGVAWSMALDVGWQDGDVTAVDMAFCDSEEQI